MNAKLSRRDFFKLTGAALGGLAFSPYLPPVTEFEDSLLVRVASTAISVHSMPNDESRIVRQVYRDQILPVYEEVNSGFPGYNPVWYRVWGGFVHRARMPKVEVRYNAPVLSIRENGQLAEVTVPFTQAMLVRKAGWEPLYRLYYGTVHWVVGVEPGPDGLPWYILMDELLDITYNVPTSHMRLIPDEEIAPLSPEVPWEEKRVEVNLGTQLMTCYEYDQSVFQTNIASGRLDSTIPANGIPTRTPAGKFNVSVKMPSKHMGDGNLAADIEAYELAGVPWTVFFTPQGHAFHGTYWHDNYGVPMSSGCINMRNHEAKWFFRWCLPSAGADEINPGTLDKKGYGTPIVIKN
ncbi:MAG: L,D-transpeptidase family protein [Anaerolineae bacterium]|nr:L,D-transpeptidase family protein [Anaerolineae bacterium]